jgi:hypothetical protein
MSFRELEADPEAQCSRAVINVWLTIGPFGIASPLVRLTATTASLRRAKADGAFDVVATFSQRPSASPSYLHKRGDFIDAVALDGDEP